MGGTQPLHLVTRLFSSPLPPPLYASHVAPPTCMSHAALSPDVKGNTKSYCLSPLRLLKRLFSFLCPLLCLPRRTLFFSHTCHTGARTPLYAALSPDVKGNTFYHNVLGIIGSSSASYDVTRGVPTYDYALEQVRKFTPSLNDPGSMVNQGSSARRVSPSETGSVSINESESRGINGAGFAGEAVNPTSGRVERAGGAAGEVGAGSSDGDREGAAGQQVNRRRL